MTKLDKERLEALAAEGRDFLAKSLQLGKVDFRIFGRLAELKRDSRVKDIELDRDELCEGFHYDVEFSRTLGLEEFRGLVENYLGKKAWNDLEIYRGPGEGPDFASMRIDRKRNSYRVRFEPIEGLDD